MAHKSVGKLEKEISSAEMTCTWRSDEPSLSFDEFSHYMATSEGTKKARDYQNSTYPLASRHFSLRAGYITATAVDLLKTGDYDSIISLGSGFSLLTYCIYRKLGTPDNITFFDSDIEPMLLARTRHLDEIKTKLDQYRDKQFLQESLDIEAAYQSQINFRTVLPKHCHNPIIILEGITYFLSPQCLQWLFTSIAQQYQTAAIVFDYWPHDASKQSRFFDGVLAYFRDYQPEAVKSLLSPDDLELQSQNFSMVADLNISDIERENKLITQSERVLTNPDTHIPARIRVLTK